MRFISEQRFNDEDLVWGAITEADLIIDPELFKHAYHKIVDADGVVYTGRFAKIALNVAHRAGHSGNVLGDLLRSWFGADAGQPGTVQYVEMVSGEQYWSMRPASLPATPDESVG